MYVQTKSQRKALGMFVLSAIALYFPSVSLGAGMIPETSVVILDEDVGEKTINVKNSDGFPVLLYSQIENLVEDSDNLVVITPPVARVEPKESQAIRFLLNADVPLKVQRLRRVTFEGIPPKNTAGGAKVGLSVRQNIPVIINPKGLDKEREPWRHLTWSIQDKKLVVENPSAYVVRLAQVVNVLPSDAPVNLPKLYVLPGEKLTMDLSGPAATGAVAIRAYPATVYGYSVDHYDAPLTK